MKFSKRAAGFSLVEIMIGAALGLFLTTGIVQIFMNNKEGYLLQSAYVVMQENARFVEYYVNRLTRMAGYRTPPASGAIYPSIDQLYPTATPYLTGTSGGATGNDSITIRFQGNADGGVVDCLNQTVSANVMATNTLSVNGSNQLVCTATNASGLTLTRTDIILDGVESLQILYGEDTNGDGSADHFVPANYPGLNFARIVSIRVGILLRTQDPLATMPSTTQYNVLGAVIAPPSDRRLRQVFNFTIQLRNIPRYRGT